MQSLKLPDLRILIIWDFQIVADTKCLEKELDVTDLKRSDSDSGDEHSGGEEAPLPSDQSLSSNTSDHSEANSEASRCDTCSPVIEHTITFKCYQKW